MVGVVGVVCAGSYKLHCELKAWKDRVELQCDQSSLGLLETLCDTNSVSADRVCLTLEAVGCTPETDFSTEIEDVLEIMPPEPDFMQTRPEIEADDTDAVMTSKMMKARKSERKRIREGAFGVALKSLVNKARLAFPVPKQNEMQIQAMNLYLHKECRKLNLRVSDAARLIPQAVAIAMVPSDQQILAAQLGGLATIQKRHLQRQWKEANPSMPLRVVNSILGFVRK